MNAAKIIFILCLICVSTSPASAVEAVREASSMPFFPEKSFLTPESSANLEKIRKSTVRIGVFSPYDYMSTGNGEAGQAAELKKLLETVFKIHSSIVIFDNESSAAEGLKKGEADMIFGLRPMVSESDFTYSNDIFSRKMYIISSADKFASLIKSNTAALYKRKAAVYDKINENALNVNVVKKFDPVSIFSVVEKDNGLDFGVLPADLAITPEMNYERMVQAYEIRDKSGKLAVYGERLTPLINALNGYYKKTGDRPFDDALERESVSLYPAIFQNLKNLTPVEKSFLEHTDNIVVYVSTDMFPLVYEEDGGYKGIYADLLSAFEEISGIPVVYRPLPSPDIERIQANLKDNEIILNYLDTDGSVPGTAIFSGYYHTPLTIYGKNYAGKDWKYVKRIGSIKNTPSCSYLREAGYECVPYDTEEELFQALKKGDVTYIAGPATTYYEQLFKGNYWIIRIETLPVEIWPKIFVYRNTSPLEPLFVKAMNGFINYQGIFRDWQYRMDATISQLIARYHINIQEQSRRQFILFSIIGFLILIAFSLYFGLRTRASTNLALANLANAEKEANKAKSRFLSNMSHEIRTPLNAILGLSQVTLKGGERADSFGAVRQIEEAARHLLAIVNDVLDMSKIESGKYVVTAGIFDIRKMIGEIKNIIDVKAGEKKQRFEIIEEEKLPRYVIGDNLGMRQIIINLLANAVKFTPEQGEVFLDIKTKNIKESEIVATFTVRDTGIGMSPEQAAKVFSPFEQADASITRSYGGTGLGLTISKRLAELMDGSLSFYTELGKGSVFMFSVPLTIPDKAPEEPETEPVKDRERKIRIMVVDDMEVNRVILSKMLAGTEAEITEASNGREAVDLYNKSNEGYYDIVLMDIHMPEMNGYDATRLIHSSSRTDAATIKIIAITASAFKEDIEAAKEAGMDDHIAKPIDINVLLKKISDLLKDKNL